ncbi:MAG: hypothetical protein IKJ61_06775, partial [Bacteroidaceae bacterium]|nr:hypothetical protein [Bacteroidaceae bacterium]
LKFIDSKNKHLFFTPQLFTLGHFIYQQTNELYESKTKNGESISTFSASVARPGIEPGTS